MNNFENGLVDYSFNVKVISHDVQHPELKKDIENFYETTVWRKNPQMACAYFVSTPRFESYGFDGEIRIVEIDKKNGLYNIEIDGVGTIQLSLLVPLSNGWPFKASGMHDHAIYKNPNIVSM